MQSVGPINIVKDYVSKETCDFLIKSFSDSFYNTENKGILGSVSSGIEYAWKITPDNPIIDRSAGEINISIDLLTNILSNISKTVSDFYEKRMDARTVFLSKMLAGSKLEAHYDNYEKTKDGIEEFTAYGANNEVIKKIGFEPDYSAILYLNNEYSGGEIEFPEYDLKFKPEPGTLIFFRGDEKAEHLVNEVISGERINLITFQWPTEYRIKYFEALKKLPELVL